MACGQPAMVAATLLLLLLLVAAGPVPPATAELEQEAAVMRRLRQARHDTNASWAAGWLGWLPDSPMPHCLWRGVGCRDGRVVSILITSELSEPLKTNGDGTVDLDTHSSSPASVSGGPGGAWPGTLLPELAQLQWLERLEQRLPALREGIPAEWGAPGAFPRLRQLELDTPQAGSALPDIQEGALPQLEWLFLRMHDMHAPLPPSWGSSATVLPRLQALALHLPFTGGLPPQWAGGFPKLEQLTISSDATSPPRTTATEQPSNTRSLAAAPTPVHLPAEWATGFRRLIHLDLLVAHVEGTLDTVWAQAFPTIVELSVSPAVGQPGGLTGTLPAEFFKWHPHLQRLRLTGNRLSGTLPDAWADLAPQVVHINLQDNQLTGPAFPTAWLEPGAMSNLSSLVLTSNQLTGSLPPHLSWPSLSVLKVNVNPAMRGQIPEAWCTALFHKLLTRLWVHGTGIDPTLPPCFASALPNLSTDIREKAEPAAAVAGHVSPVALIVGATLAAGTIVVSAAAGRALLRRRRRQRRAAEQSGQQGTEHAVLLRASELETRQLKGSRHEASNRRARIGAVLQRGGTHSIALLQVHSLPAALQHQMAGSGQGGRESGCVGPLPIAASSQPGDIELQQLRQPLQRGGSTGMPPDMLGSWVEASASSSMPSRQWRMGTTSLQLGVDELTLPTDSWGQLIVLGEGSTATVYLAELQGHFIALKVIELAPGMSSQLFWQEAQLLRHCNHDRIVPLYGVGIQSNLLLLAMGLMDGGSLKLALSSEERRDGLRWEASGRQVAVDVAEALAYLHEQNVLHGDVCARNVLLDAHNRACLGDLGLSQYLQTARTRTVLGASTLYAAPEVLLGRRCTLSADIYSFGVLLVELTTRTLGVTRGRHLPSVPDDCPQEVLALIEECIVQDPVRRPTAARVLQRLREVH